MVMATKNNWWGGYADTPDILERGKKALTAMADIGDDWLVMNDYRNANPQTRGSYDEFRTKYYHDQAVKRQRVAEAQAANPTNPGVVNQFGDEGIPYYGPNTGNIAGYLQPTNNIFSPPVAPQGYSLTKPVFAGTGGTGGGAVGGTGVGGSAGSLAPSLGGGKWWEGGGVQWPSLGLSQAASGGVPGQANLLPSLGAPGFLSPQSMSRLTPSELDIYGSEVERRGFPMQDWQSQLQQQWGGFASPGQFGGGVAFRAPGRIR